MFSHNTLKEVDLKVSINWFLLSFLSGSVNAGGYLACGRFVSHVTGFATLFGIDGANGNWDRAFGILSVPLFFLLGVMISAYFIDRRAHRGQHPRYAIVMALAASCLLIAAIGGHLGFFGLFGGEAKLKQDYVLLVLLCAASGLQNAAISTSSGAIIRTTHLTGITTDLGIDIVRALTDKSRNHERYKLELKASQLRIGTIISFASGSAIGAGLFLKAGYLGFLLPAVLAIYAMIVAHATGKRTVISRK